jgi:predicted ABC-type ATPase
VVLFFLWIPDAAFSKSRIRERVEHGGHNIPDDAIYRRYPRIMHNLVKIYIPLCDKVLCYDNSESEPVIVFEQDSTGQKISNNDIYERIIRCANGCKRNT